MLDLNYKVSTLVYIVYVQIEKLLYRRRNPDFPCKQSHVDKYFMTICLVSKTP